MAGKYYAMCEGNHLITVGWQGPSRDTEEEAQRDAGDHKRDTYDHIVEVIYDPLG